MTPIEVDMTNPMVQKADFSTVKKGDVQSIGSTGQKAGGVMEEASSGGAGWQRQSGALHGGTEQLGSTLPEAKKKTPSGTADEIMFEDNLAIA